MSNWIQARRQDQRSRPQARPYRADQGPRPHVLGYSLGKCKAELRDLALMHELEAQIWKERFVALLSYCKSVHAKAASLSQLTSREEASTNEPFEEESETQEPFSESEPPAAYGVWRQAVEESDGPLELGESVPGLDMPESESSFGASELDEESESTAEALQGGEESQEETIEDGGESESDEEAPEEEQEDEGEGVESDVEQGLQEREEPEPELEPVQEEEDEEPEEESGQDIEVDEQLEPEEPS
jgi:hypothetical protein